MKFIIKKKVDLDLRMTMKDMDDLFDYNQDEYSADAPWILERREAFVAYLEKVNKNKEFTLYGGCSFGGRR